MAEVDLGCELCDSIFIADLVATLSRSECATRPVCISARQVKELQLKTSEISCGQSNLIDSIGSLFCICLYCVQPATFGTIEEAASCAVLLESIASECLAVIRTNLSDIIHSNGGSIHIANPQTVLSSEITRSLIKQDVSLLALDALSLAKEILADVAGLLLPSRNKLQQTNKTLKDCVSVHTVYFMCCFGLFHIGIASEGSWKVSSIPGLCEMLILMSLCSFSAGEVNLETPSNKQQAVGAVPKIRFTECMTQARLLGIAAVNCCIDERALQETRLVRSRMTKLLRKDSKIELAEFQSASFKSFLDRSWERRGRDGAERHFNAEEIDKDEKEDKKKEEEGCSSDARHCESTEVMKSQEPSNSPQHIKRNSVISLKILDGLVSGLGSGSCVRAGWEWKLPKHMRGAYCVLQRARNKMPYAEYFNTPNRHRPPLAMPHTGLFKVDLTRRADVIELAYLAVDESYVPRILDPSYPLYWAAGHLVEHIYQLTVALDRDRDRGKGALPRSLAEVARGMRGDLRCMRAQAAVKRDQAAAVHSSDPSTHTQATTSASPIRSSSLEQRLKGAVQLARVERGLYEVEKRISCIRSQERGLPFLLSADLVLMNGVRMLCSVRSDPLGKGTRRTGLDSPLPVCDQSGPSLSRTVGPNIEQTLDLSEQSAHNSRLAQVQQFRSRVGVMCEHLSSGCREGTGPIPMGSHLGEEQGEGERGAGKGAGRPRVLMVKDSSSWVHGPSPVAASAYIESILKYQMCIKNAELDKSQQMSLELQRGVLATHSRRQREAGDAKEERRRVRRECKEYLAMAAEEKKVQVIESRRRERADRKELQILSERATKNAEDYKAVSKNAIDAAERVERVALLRMRERERDSERRLAEESVSLMEDANRMKVLEEQQRLLREKAAENMREEQVQLACRRERVKGHADAATSRLRVGTFQWVGGVYGFYDNVLPDPDPPLSSHLL